MWLYTKYVRRSFKAEHGYHNGRSRTVQQQIEDSCNLRYTVLVAYKEFLIATWKTIREVYFCLTVTASYRH